MGEWRCFGIERLFGSPQKSLVANFLLCLKIGPASDAKSSLGEPVFQSSMSPTVLPLLGGAGGEALQLDFLSPGPGRSLSFWISTQGS